MKYYVCKTGIPSDILSKYASMRALIYSPRPQYDPMMIYNPKFSNGGYNCYLTANISKQDLTYLKLKGNFLYREVSCNLIRNDVLNIIRYKYVIHFITYPFKYLLSVYNKQ